MTDRPRGEEPAARTSARTSADGTAEENGQPVETFGEIIRTVIYALLIALVFRTVLFQPFSIPSGSMKPTLLIGDYLFVSKYSYGYSRYSLPYGNLLPSFGGRLFGSVPERGDVIVFRNPKNENQDYIKRLVGLPGDRVKMRRGVLFLNDQPMKLERIESYIAKRDQDDNCIVSQRALAGLGVPPADRSRIAADRNLCLKVQFIETLPNGTRHPVLDTDGGGGALDNTDEVTVPAGHYFFVGDNRDNSEDSRKIGGIEFVPAENLIGRAEMILLSSDGPFWQVWNWRSDRFFKSID